MTTAPHQGRQTIGGTGHATLFVLIVVFLDMVGLGLILPVLPELITQIGHVDLAHASKIGGLMFAAFSLAQFLFAPLMGNLSDRSPCDVS